MTTPVSPQLQAIRVGDSADAWVGAGFMLRDSSGDAGRMMLGQTALLLVGGSRRGILGLGLDGVKSDRLSLFDVGTEVTGLAPGYVHEHPNGVGSIDHVVMMSGDSDATTRALVACGLEPRRVRQFKAGGAEQRQTFFLMGDVILELVGPDEPELDPGPATLWGLALNCDDIEATVTELGPSRVSATRDAVQPGRRIATMRTSELGISVAIALMSPHGGD